MLLDTLKKENMLALKEKNNNKRAVLSVLINKIQLEGVEKKAKGLELEDSDVIRVIQKTVKELQDEKKSYEDANRLETAANIQAQIDYISVFLPKMMDEDEIRAVILGLEDKSMPSVMKHFKQNYAGKCDMGLVNKVLKSL